MDLFHPAPADVAFLIFDRLPLDSLVSLRCTSRSADDLFSRYFNSRLRAALGLFFADEDAFLQEMSTSSSIITGACALSILARCSWTSDELDICIPFSYFGHVVSYLIHIENYYPAFAKSTAPSDDPICDGLCVKLFRGRAVINVIRSRGQCPLQPLRKTWTTTHMCYISATTFSIAYPVLTERHRSVLRACRLEDHWYPSRETQDLIRAYREKGFDIRLDAVSWLREDEQEDECEGAGSENCPLTVRYMGDRFTVKGGCWPITRARPRGPKTSYLDDLTLVWWQGGIHHADECRGHGSVTEPSWSILPRSVLGSRT
ncbi:hypothetical protein TRAPUB_4920 [Trametes pubescens]|uniref:F-box domain-containing protein n=1 Tax=Trametes pubescens TaxID=154538 RepID=A0A1M2VA15_TRAPU|nr:hypothetical protein TRAPUB_4920 [Trametes pubescens]